MSFLISHEILDSVKKELTKATTSVQIITAYCRTSSFKLLDSYINKSVQNKRLLVRFRMDDVLKGSTDFDLIETAKKLGWTTYIRFDLHAKTYIVDNKRGLKVSANATNSGLGIGKVGNMEMATLVDIDEKDINKVEKLFRDAILIDQSILEKMKIQLNETKCTEKSSDYCWDVQITSLFNPKIETLFSYELPEKKEYHKGDTIAFLDSIYTNKEDFKDSLRWSTSYLWLINVLRENDGCMYFGLLSTELHNALISDPKPYRRDVKEMLANLLNIIENMSMDEIIIDRPNYSQRVRLKR